MTALRTGVSRRDNHDDPSADCFLGSLVDNAFGTRNVLVAAQRNIQDANVVTLAIRNHPLDAASDVFFRYATAFADFNEHEFRFVRQAAIDAVAQSSITCGRDGGLCSVPLPCFDWCARNKIQSPFRNAVISYDA